MKNFWLCFFAVLSFSISALDAGCKNEISEREVTFDVLDVGQIPQNTPFKTTITIKEDHGMVFVSIPPLNFTLPDEHLALAPEQIPNRPPVPPIPLPAGGYLTLVDGFIPKHLSPNDSVGFVTTVDSINSSTLVPQPLDIRITKDGNIIFSFLGLNPVLEVGPFNTFGITISYPKPHFNKAPTNFVLSKRETTVFDLPSCFQGRPLFGQLGDTYTGTMFNGIFGAYWTNDSKSNSNYLSSHTRMGKVEREGDRLEVKLQSKPVLAVSGPLNAAYFVQGGIAINPTNPRNVVFNSLGIGCESGPSVNIFQLWRGVSNDGGNSWSNVGRIDGVNGIPYTRSDNNAIFDRFGNYWLTTATYNPPAQAPSDDPVGLAILVSSDGGQSFQVAYSVDPTTLSEPGVALDFNQLAFGGDGNGGWALYFSADLFPINIPAVIPVIGYIPVTGLGSFGTPQITFLYSLANLAIIPRITASEEGDIFLAFNGFAGTGASFSSSIVLHKTGGINNLVDGSFAGPYLNAFTDLGLLIQASPGIGSIYTSYNSQNVRGNITPPVRGLAYDERAKILYQLHLSCDPIYSQNQSLYLIASKNGGQTWSKPFAVKDFPKGNASNANLTIDPVTRDLFVTWYDSRNDQPNNRVLEFFGAIVSKRNLREHLKGLATFEMGIVSPEENARYQLSLPRPSVEAIKSRIDSRKNRPLGI